MATVVRLPPRVPTGALAVQEALKLRARAADLSRQAMELIAEAEKLERGQ